MTHLAEVVLVGLMAGILLSTIPISIALFGISEHLCSIAVTLDRKKQ